MIRRPLHERFSGVVRSGVKTTTMREKAWPVGALILLYNWSEKPYRSKQVEVAVVVVEQAVEVCITRTVEDKMHFERMEVLGDSPSLWQTEGFESREEMQDWFLPLVKPGRTIKRKLMRFKMVEERGAA